MSFWRFYWFPFLHLVCRNHVFRNTVSLVSLKNIFLQRHHIYAFQLWNTSKNKDAQSKLQGRLFPALLAKRNGLCFQIVKVQTPIKLPAVSTSFVVASWRKTLCKTCEVFPVLWICWAAFFQRANPMVQGPISLLSSISWFPFFEYFDYIWKRVGLLKDNL